MSEHFRKPRAEEQTVLERLQVSLLESVELPRCNQLLRNFQKLWMAGGGKHPKGKFVYAA